MKYTFFFSLSFILSTVYVNAQVAIKPAIGINFSDFSKDATTGEYKSKVGYQIGGSVAFGKKWYFEPGIFYVKKTTEYADENSQTEDLDFNLTGIRIPVAIGLNLIGHEKSAFGLRVFGGPSAFILTSKTFPTGSEINNASFGVFAGAGLDITIIFVEATYEWSLTDISKDISTVDVGKSRSLFVHAGVRILL